MVSFERGTDAVPRHDPDIAVLERKRRRLRSNGGSDKIIAGTGADRIEASNAVINTGDGDDTVIGSGNTINEAFSFNFDALLT